ncbi:hypothetical protein BDN72DRAFT_830142 [Pluteus cervinus]|uniref:Uncharacterized protein n=1 Tax=Pluteus cervinus TaxID=181527 RepID=A0ACD3BG07_9AGAR|nr:hypothetical protein BDN72DRAFT_830142 [Pluteus cervinus]
MSTPNNFNLDSDSAIESVLSDIPLFCVGILAFGVFTFFLVMKRVTLSMTFLYSSAFFAFSGAILDLSLILAGGRANTNLGPNSTPPPSALTPAREVCFAMAVGFVYLFIWTFVATCPRAEESHAQFDGVHSAKWERWGTIGHVIKWSSLAAVASIPILQIVWRLTVSQRDFNQVYVAEATLEIVASAIFILKLLLNVFLSPIEPMWKPLSSYTIPFISISMSLGLGIGNLLLLQFSETTTGRLLQAVELYIFILFVLISAFSTNNPQGPTRLSMEKPLVANIPASQNSFPNERIYPIRSLSRTPDSTAMARIVSWVSSRRTSRYSVGIEQKRIPDLEGAVRADPPQAPGITVDFRVLTQEAPIKVPNFPVVQLQPPPRPPRPMSSGSFLEVEQRQPSQRPSPAMDMLRPLTQNTEASNYSSSIAQSGPDSPVYGLNGIITEPGESQPETRNASFSSFDELLRQQTELDKSIAALRLFSSATGPEPQRDSTPINLPVSLGSSSNLTKGRTESTSAHSEFSLSNFPVPPAVDEEEIPIPDSSRRQPQDVPKGFSTMFASTPTQPTPSGGDTGSRYDVTSFIGDLTLNPSPPTDSSLNSLTIASPLSTRGRVKPFNTIPTRPRLQISAPRLLPQDGTDAPPGVFEKPRPPPLRFTQGS